MKKHLGPYEILSKIGSGGMAEVFKAKKSLPVGIEKIVAIKRILPPLTDRRDYMSMFEHEAKIHASLHHPNLISFQDLVEVDGQWLMELEYFPSKNLSDFLDLLSRPTHLPWQMGIWMVCEVLEALDHIHNANLNQGHLQIIHRDVNPQNILISKDGRVKLSDLGISKSILQTRLTATGSVKGKIPYMSPEQLEGNELTPSSDLFSVGIVLFELLYHQHPFLRSNELLTGEAIRKDSIQCPEHTGFPKALLEILKIALNKNPSRRFETALEFKKSLLFIQETDWHQTPKLLVQQWIDSHFSAKEYTIESPVAQTAVFEKPQASSNEPFQKEKAEIEHNKQKAWLIGLLVMGFAFVLVFIFLKPRAIDTNFSDQAPSTPFKDNPPVKDGKQLSPLLKTQSTSQKQEVVDTGKKFHSKVLPPKPQNAELYIKGTVGALVYINGKEIGSLPLPSIRVDPNHYLIFIKSLDGTSCSKKISAKNGQELVVQCN